MSRRSICVFCSSSNHVAPEFFAVARALGHALARRQHELIFGGTAVGLMGEVAKAAHEGGARVVGIMPRAFTAHNTAFDLADEMIITQDLRERKAAMEARAEAFITMAGGFGTLEEVLEILTLRQLEYHTKPVVLLNTNGFYDHLVEFFDRLRRDKFTKQNTPPLYYVAKDEEDALDYIARYEPVTTGGTWF